MGWLSRLSERFAAPTPASNEQILARLMPMWQSARPLPKPHDYRAFAQDGFRRNAMIFACFPAGAQISLADGTSLPIEAVRKGEFVRTHTGEIQRVLVVMARPHVGAVVSLSRVGRTGAIEVTPEHPFLAAKRPTANRWFGYKGRARKKQGKALHELKPEWIKASDLRKKDFLLEPIPSKVVDLHRVSVISNRVHSGTLTTDVAIDAQTMRLLGYYLAEGWVSGNSVHFAFHRKETEYHADVVRLMKRTFHVEVKRYAGLELGQRACLTFNSTAAVAFFRGFGKGAKMKRLPEWVMNLPIAKQAGLLVGYWRGDGTKTDHGFRIDSVNNQLLEQLRLISLRHGLCPSLTNDTAQSLLPNGKRIVRTLYHLWYGGVHARKLAELLGEDSGAKTDRAAAFILDGYAYYTIRSIHIDQRKYEVYNLEVEKDNSYLAEGVAVHNCITEISTSAAEPPLDALRMRGEEAVKLPATDPLSMLLAKPNPEQSRYELLSTLATHLHVAGNGYLHKVRARNGKPVQLWPLRPDRVEIKPGRNGLVEAYAYSIGGAATMIPAEDVVHFTMHPDPLDDYYGLSPIAVLARFGDLDNSATDFLRAFFLNAGVPGGLLTFKAGRVGKDERERVRQLFRDQFSTSKGWHDVGVMDADVSYQELGSVPKKLDLSTIWGVTESRICMVFGVPAVLVGAWIGLQNSTFANYETAQKSLWQETLSPFYVRLADKLTMGVASEFGPDRLARFDLSKVQALQEARAVREARARKNWENGLLTMNEARLEQGYSEVPDGNMRKAPAFPAFPAPVQQWRVLPVPERHALPKFVDNAPDDPFYLAVHKIADRLTPELRDAFLRGVLAMDGGIDQQTLIAAVESGDMERAFAAIPFEAFADSLKTGGGDVLLKAIAEAGMVAATTLQDTHGLTITFDLTNPRAQAFAATQTATMVTEVTEGTKDAIRAIIERGFSEGLTPQQMAMEIRRVVGLTSRQAAAVTNFRMGLMADGIEGDALASRVDKYAAAQLRYRGTMIARTESLTASNAGQRELWLQARDKGLLPSNQKREWVLTPDGRLCTTICEPMDGVTVGLDEPWHTSAGAVMIPQQSHPQCRCASALVIAT